jgi:hypothetical protein
MTDPGDLIAAFTPARPVLPHGSVQAVAGHYQDWDVLRSPGPPTTGCKGTRCRGRRSALVPGSR